MKKVITVSLTVLLVIAILTNFCLPVIGDQFSDEQVENNDNQPIIPRGGTQRSSYTAYYNKTFSIDKSWESENVSVIAFVQTQDQKTKNKESGGSSGTFKSAEVLQSTIDFLSGDQKRTACCRRVFFELITATWCGNCPGADGAFDRISRDPSLFPGKITMVEIHPSSTGDFYNADSLARHNWYNHGSSHPTAIFDGLYAITGGAGSDPNVTNADTMYENIINQRQPVVPVIDLITFGEKTESSGWINLSIELLNPTPVRNLKVQFVVVEDVYPYQTGHEAYLRYTLRDMLPPEDFTPPNHAPTIKSSLSDVNIIEDGSDFTTIQLAPAFEDEDLDVLTFYSNRDEANKEKIDVEIDDTGNVTLTPDPNWNGEEEITFFADDGVANPLEQTIKVTVTSVNDAPIVAEPMLDFTTYEDLPVMDKFDLSEVFGDVDLNPEINAEPQAPLEFSYSGNTNIVVSITNNNVSFDPVPNWNGEETLTFTATDASDSGISDDVKIKVTSENDPPVLTKPIPEAILNEDETLTEFLDLNEYFFDQDGDSLTYEFDKPENLDVKLNYKQSSVLLSLTPHKNYWGTETIIFTVTDLLDSEPVTGEMKVTVNPMNDAPILNATDDWDVITSSTSIKEKIISIDQDNPTNIFVTAYDPADNDILSYSDDTILFDIDSETGEIDFTPTNDDVGEYIVTITIDDRQTENNLAIDEFIFLVLNVNDPPETPQILSPTEGNTYLSTQEIMFKGVCEDPDLDITDSDENLNFEWISEKSSKSLSFESEFSTKLQPGVHTITLIVRDNTGAKSTAEISITVEIDKNLDTDTDGTPDYLDDDDDGDGMPDEWENKYPEILDPLNPTDANKDPDEDDFTNLEEFLGNDGESNSDDSTDPTRKKSHPESESSGDSGAGTKSTSNAYLIAVVLGAVIVVLLLIFLFFFMKKRKKAETKDSTTTTHPPQRQQAPQQPQQKQQPPDNMVSFPQPQQPASQQQMHMPMMHALYPNPPVQQPMPAQQPQMPRKQTQVFPPNAMGRQKTCPGCGLAVKEGWFICPNCKGLI